MNDLLDGDERDAGREEDAEDEWARPGEYLCW